MMNITLLAAQAALADTLAGGPSMCWAMTMWLC